ncbi:hypothetical protein K431DRAFT_289875 [Polychaeton citri CBS 116435]|uniref:Myb/SANT-like domain-containing protein n=1 Tax=Polychaeton citri CBS 116435 TaxID=1314669 RepID=A0A9P4UK24_9PEZI|nr:hypothetical protein K431DRAFT_289875 [Polychaeton citri CBS 116435]
MSQTPTPQPSLASLRSPGADSHEPAPLRGVKRRRISKDLSRSRIGWEETEVGTLLDCLCELARNGKQTDGHGFKMAQFNEVARHLSATTGKSVTGKQCRNKFDVIKGNWMEWGRHLRRISGWGRASDNGAPYADTDTEDSYFASHLKARQFRGARPLFFNQCTELFGNELANGGFAKGINEMMESDDNEGLEGLQEEEEEDLEVDWSTNGDSQAVSETTSSPTDRLVPRSRSLRSTKTADTSRRQQNAAVAAERGTYEKLIYQLIRQPVVVPQTAVQRAISRLQRLDGFREILPNVSDRTRFMEALLERESLAHLIEVMLDEEVLELVRRKAPEMVAQPLSPTLPPEAQPPPANGQ